jgi:hypothetical protein
MNKVAVAGPTIAVGRSNFFVEKMSSSAPLASVVVNGAPVE